MKKPRPGQLSPYPVKSQYTQQDTVKIVVTAVPFGTDMCYGIVQCHNSKDLYTKIVTAPVVASYLHQSSSPAPM
jgi:hypothetical protein